MVSANTGSVTSTSWSSGIFLLLMACFVLGACWDSSPKPIPDDISSLTKDAESGQANAQYHLGLRYAKGVDVAKDEVIAVAWYRKAAEQGHAEAQRTLGVCYATGTGATKDNVIAATWYRKAAEQGDASAQWFLGFDYAKGTGVPKDDLLAYKWLNLSAAQGIADAAKLRDDISKTMTHVQVAEAQRLSREWKPAEGMK